MEEWVKVGVGSWSGPGSALGLIPKLGAVSEGSGPGGPKCHRVTGMVAWLLPHQARNKAGQIGYVPEKYLLSLGCVGSEPSLATGTGVVGPSGAALQRQLSSIMAAELVLEPGGGCVGHHHPGMGLWHLVPWC